MAAIPQLALAATEPPLRHRQHGIENDALLHVVDLALYAAKGAGRNQVIGFNHLVYQ
ncbi:hypothetical protein PGN35_013460 [Nodosilinea sp. PGN35]|uniref:hypothetical protein n=1 Tax=Nodosilinea sp. PGN35 TaxID=3020489 RepID=UPI0023B23C07|nr:hypothetical protein [Nodosilinea sp. TSF1-S3]MDF0366170.1 hypothetical protein [Nodosilinea sp. TSF1-S3]